MKLFKEVLPPALIQDCFTDITDKLQTRVWSDSDLFWEEGIKVGITGSVAVTYPSKPLSDLIIEKTKVLLPECRELVPQYYIWKKHAGISGHTDENHRFGATIYLNFDWNIDYGGILIYREDEELRAFAPTFNTMVVNDSHQWHMVTPVSPLAAQNRVTIQIWGRYQ